MATYTSLSGLKNAIINKLEDAVEETIDLTYQDAQQNVDNFYNSPEGRYKRTGQLGASVEYAVSGTQGEVSLDTGYRYVPSGRDTATIYEYAESGGLLGNGGFWQKTTEDCEKNIKLCFEKRFN